MIGTIPDWSNWTNVNDIQLQYNQLSGNIPPMTKWAKHYITRFNLHNNRVLYSHFCFRTFFLCFFFYLFFIFVLTAGIQQKKK